MDRLHAIVVLVSIVSILSIFIQLKLGLVNLRLSDIYSNNQHTNIPKENHDLRPHILFIIADDLGFNDVGYHGSEIKTPNIDRLAMTGLRLENYYVQPVCTPTRGQLLSGKHEIYTGLHWVYAPASPTGLPLEYLTIADRLKEAGYSTHMVGKWHIGFHKREFLPTERGFDTFFGFLSGHSDYFSHVTVNWNVRKMTGYDLLVNDHPADAKRYNGSYSTHLFTEKVDDIIWTHGIGKPCMGHFKYRKKQYEHIKNDNRRRYAGMVTCMDEAIGHIEDTLKNRGIWNNTLLIFTTDNGGSLRVGGSNWPLKGGKGNYWEGGVRAVGFVNSARLGRINRENVLRELIHVSDWYPTLVNLAGGNLEGKYPLDGYDQWQTLQFGVPSLRREILHNISPYNMSDIKNIASMRLGSWKIMIEDPANAEYKSPIVDKIRTGRGIKTKCFVSKFIKENKIFISTESAEQGLLTTYIKPEQIRLFNIEIDPNEDHDLSSTNPEIVRKMIERLKVYEKGMLKASPPGIDLQADPKFHGGFWLPWK